MAVTAETRNDIIELVVTGWNSAPGTSLLTTLVAIVDDGGSVADVAAAITAGDTFKSIYPTFLTVEEFANGFLDNLVPSASEDARAEGVAAISFVLNNGGTRADVLLEAQTFLSGLSEVDPNFGEPAAAFNNKVEVATFHTVEQQRDADSLSSLQSVLTGVTADDDTVTAAKESITTGGAGTGTTSFTLTDSIDTLTGTSGNDLVIGDSTTASAADTLEMGDGTDTVRLFQTATLPSLNSVEIAQFYNLTDQDINTANASSLTSIVVQNSELDDDAEYDLANDEILTLNNVSVDGGAHTLTIDTGNTDDTLILNDTSLTGSTDSMNLDFDDTENLTIQTTGDGSSIPLEGDDLVTVTVTGDQELTIQVANADAPDLETIDLSAAGDDQEVVFNEDVDIEIIGSANDDSVDMLASAFDEDDTLDGGDGTDEIEISNTSDNIAGDLNLVNFERVRVNTDITSNVNLDFDNVEGITDVRVGGSSTTTNDSHTHTLVDIATSATTITFLGPVIFEDLDYVWDGLNMDYDTTSDVDTVTVNFTNVGTAADDWEVQELNLTKVLNVAINVGDADTLVFNNDLVISDAESLTVTATTDVDFDGVTGGTDLESIDASGSTGDIDFGTISDLSDSEDIEITLGSGDDTIVYGDGTDEDVTLDGGAGSDTINLGQGDNEITTGSGSDTVTLDAGGGVDTITDFSAGQGGDVLAGLTATEGGSTSNITTTLFVADAAGTDTANGGFNVVVDESGTDNEAGSTSTTDVAAFLADITGAGGTTFQSPDTDDEDIYFIAIQIGNDAHIYEVDETDTGTAGSAVISATELTLIGTLEGAEATDLTAANFANFL